MSTDEVSDTQIDEFIAYADNEIDEVTSKTWSAGDADYAQVQAASTFLAAYYCYNRVHGLEKKAEACRKRAFELLNRLKGDLKRALTRKVDVKGSRGSTRSVEVEPSEKLLYAVYFAIIALICLTTLQIVHLIVVGQFNGKIMSATSLVIGTLMGVFFGKKA